MHSTLADVIHEDKQSEAGAMSSPVLPFDWKAHEPKDYLVIAPTLEMKADHPLHFDTSPAYTVPTKILQPPYPSKFERGLYYHPGKASVPTQIPPFTILYESPVLLSSWDGDAKRKHPRHEHELAARLIQAEDASISSLVETMSNARKRLHGQAMGTSTFMPPTLVAWEQNADVSNKKSFFWYNTLKQDKRWTKEDKEERKAVTPPSADTIVASSSPSVLTAMLASKTFVVTPKSTSERLAQNANGLLIETNYWGRVMESPLQGRVVGLAFVDSWMSAIVHSCEPNCGFILTKNKMVLYTLRPIHANTELTIAYRASMAEQHRLYPSWTGRQQWSEDHCSFHCQCRVCRTQEFLYSKDTVYPPENDTAEKQLKWIGDHPDPRVTTAEQYAQIVRWNIKKEARHRGDEECFRLLDTIIKQQQEMRKKRLGFCPPQKRFFQLAQKERHFSLMALQMMLQRMPPIDTLNARAPLIQVKVEELMVMIRNVIELMWILPPGSISPIVAMRGTPLPLYSYLLRIYPCLSLTLREWVGVALVSSPVATMGPGLFQIFVSDLAIRNHVDTSQVEHVLREIIACEMVYMEVAVPDMLHETEAELRRWYLPHPQWKDILRAFSGGNPHTPRMKESVGNTPTPQI